LAYTVLQIFYQSENFGIGGGIAQLPTYDHAPVRNRILIAGCRPAQKFVSEKSSCAHRFGNSN